MYFGIPPWYPEGFCPSLPPDVPNRAPIPPPISAAALSLINDLKLNLSLAAPPPAVALLYWFAVVIVVCRPPWLNLFTVPPFFAANVYGYKSSSSSSSVRYGGNMRLSAISNKYLISTNLPGSPATWPGLPPVGADMPPPPPPLLPVVLLPLLILLLPLTEAPGVSYPPLTAGRPPMSFNIAVSSASEITPSLLARIALLFKISSISLLIPSPLLAPTLPLTDVLDEASSAMLPEAEYFVSAASLSPATEYLLSAASLPPVKESWLSAALLPPTPEYLVSAASLPPVKESWLSAALLPPTPEYLVSAASLPPVKENLLSAASLPPVKENWLSAALPPTPEYFVSVAALPPVTEGAVSSAATPYLRLESITSGPILVARAAPPLTVMLPLAADAPSVIVILAGVRKVSNSASETPVCADKFAMVKPLSAKAFLIAALPASPPPASLNTFIALL